MSLCTTVRRLEYAIILLYYFEFTGTLKCLNGVMYMYNVYTHLIDNPIAKD